MKGANRINVKSVTVGHASKSVKASSCFDVRCRGGLLAEKSKHTVLVTDVAPPENDSALADPELLVELKVFDKTKFHGTAKVTGFSLSLRFVLDFMLFTYCRPFPA